MRQSRHQTIGLTFYSMMDLGIYNRDPQYTQLKQDTMRIRYVYNGGEDVRNWNLSDLIRHSRFFVDRWRLYVAANGDNQVAADGNNQVAADGNNQPAANEMQVNDMASSSSSSSLALVPVQPLYGPPGGHSRGSRSIILRQPGGCSVEILLYGAQVISWTNKCGQESLFLGTKQPDFDPLHPMHGGIQIFFPKFLDNENKEQRGFARRSLWSCDLRVSQETDTPPPPVDHLFADFILDHTHIDPIDYKNWPNKFEFRLRYILGPTGTLMMISRIKNLNDDGRSFKFRFSYQNYLTVFDLSAVRIEGLEKRDYLDYMNNKQRFTQGDDALAFNGAVDMLYLRTPDRITIEDIMSERTFTIEKNGFLPNIVVWNPWDKDGDASLPAFREPEVEYRKMVCVETAVQTREVCLTVNNEWMAMQLLYNKKTINPKKPAV